jgi:stearoyl-CoA desaturase (delta-9 desaturase)
MAGDATVGNTIARNSFHDNGYAIDLESYGSPAPTPNDGLKDFARFPELRFINRWDTLPGIALGVILYFIGEALSGAGSSVTGWQLVIWGVFISTVVVYHATYTINSLAHIFGSRRYETTDTSRNNFLLSLLTLGEGWHNNHHYYQASCRQGFYWWELDITYYGLRVLSWFRLIWDLKPVPARVRAHRAAAPE